MADVPCRIGTRYAQQRVEACNNDISLMSIDRHYKNNKYFSHIVDSLVPEDFSVVEGNRLMNLKKLYPFMPDSLDS